MRDSIFNYDQMNDVNEQIINDNDFIDNNNIADYDYENKLLNKNRIPRTEYITENYLHGPIKIHKYKMNDDDLNEKNKIDQLVQQLNDENINEESVYNLLNKLQIQINQNDIDEEEDEEEEENLLNNENDLIISPDELDKLNDDLLLLNLITGIDQEQYSNNQNDINNSNNEPLIEGKFILFIYLFD